MGMLWAPVDLGPRGAISRVQRAGPDSAAHSNMWYQSPWLKNLKNLMGHMMTGEPVNVSEVTRVVRDRSVRLGA